MTGVICVAMKQTKVRFEQGEYEAVKSVADEYGVSFAHVVRLAVAGNLDEYLGTVKYLDREQGDEINRGICNLGNLLQSIRNELRRIGVNYNQEIRLRNIEAKIAEEEEYKPIGNNGRVNQQRRLEALYDERAKVESKGVFKLDDVERLINQLDKAAGKLGDALCRIRQ